MSILKLKQEHKKPEDYLMEGLVAIRDLPMLDQTAPRVYRIAWEALEKYEEAIANDSDR
jgi:hypothetical protein